jgi:branched-subunit amino acid aminotransferase/4-amino-4-deoxychorismate lyase
MKAIFNDELLDFKQIELGIQDRGFCYGDGLFETMAVIKSKPRFLQRHFDRLVKGSSVLGLSLDQITMEYIQENCFKLIRENAIEDFGKLRLTVWRKGDGLYVPAVRRVNYLLTAAPADLPILTELTRVGFSEKLVNYPAIHTSFKTISALKYVLAGQEKKERGLEEIIINDHNGFVSEALESNIFMKKDEVYYTPPIATGCIEGVMRNWLIDELKSRKVAVEECFITPGELLQAESAFTTNAMGIRHILQIQNAVLTTDRYIQELHNSIT